VRAFIAITIVLAASVSAQDPDVVALHDALARNDRVAFDANLPRVRDAGEGAEIYDHIALLWDAQFVSPFFDPSSEAYRVVSAYPGYEEAVRRHVLVDDAGRRFYPAAESRAFLTRIAAARFGALPRVAPRAAAPRQRVTKQ
jgi:hypothetical protein